MTANLSGHRFRRFMLSFEGFDEKNAEDWIYLKSIKKHAVKNNLGLSAKTILSLLPFDARVDASLLPSGEKTHQLFSDVLSTSYMLARHKGIFPEVYFSLLMRDGKQLYLPFGEAVGKYSRDAEGVAELLTDKGELLVRPSENKPWVREQLFSFDGESYFIDGKKKSYHEIILAIISLPPDSVFCESIKSDYPFTLHVSTLNRGKPEFLFSVLTEEQNCEAPDWYTKNHVIAELNENGEYDGGTVPDFKSILGRLLEISAEFTDLEYMSYSIRLNKNGFKIIQIDTGRDLCFINHFNEKTADFLKRKLSHHRRLVTTKQAAVIFYRALWSIRASLHGFTPLMYRNWRRALRADKHDRFTTRAEKRWAHKRGFLSYHIKQYGLTDENYTQCLSDRDYKWLRPLNCTYLKWVWDKVSLRYVLDRFSAHLPEYYYNIVRRDGKPVLLTMQDTPAGYAATFEDVLRLLREKGVLALKQTEGSHGVGFYKLEYTDGRYFANSEEKSADEMLSFLRSLKKYYSISEYIVMHQDLRRIYSAVACTIRVMVINRTGCDPVIENVYFRIGTKRTGFTDNIGSGGVFAYADEDTGHFHDAEIIKNHIITPCPEHPDTGVEIEGTFPHWKEVCSEILDICRYISPLEYMGFDVVITDSGFKILEINTHQDLHRYPTYNDDVHSYFMHKLELKKEGVPLV